MTVASAADNNSLSTNERFSKPFAGMDKKEDKGWKNETAIAVVRIAQATVPKPQ
jgi:hypothetical protein